VNKNLRISGRVQGVGFRYSAQQKAMEFNLVGWVKNNTDGTVELEVEGDDCRVSEYIKALKSGLNPFIQVDYIEERNSSEENKHYNRFSIK
jgi:acylphosphatase